MFRDLKSGQKVSPNLSKGLPGFEEVDAQLQTSLGLGRRMTSEGSAIVVQSDARLIQHEFITRALSCLPEAKDTICSVSSSLHELCLHWYSVSALLGLRLVQSRSWTKRDPAGSRV